MNAAPLTLAHVQAIANDLWSRHFGWRLYRRWLLLPLIPGALFVLSLVGLIAAASASPDPLSDNPVRVFASAAGEIQIIVNETVWEATQEGQPLPVVVPQVTATLPMETAFLWTTLALLFISGLGFCAWLTRYQEDKRDFVNASVESWICHSGAELPNNDALERFVARKLKE